MIFFRSTFFWLVLLLSGFFSVSASATVIAPKGVGSSAGGTAIGFHPGWTALEYCQHYYPSTTGIRQDGPWAGAYWNEGTVVLRDNGTLLAYCQANGVDIPGAYTFVGVSYCDGVRPEGVAPDYTCVSCPSGTVQNGGSCEVVQPCPPDGESAFEPADGVQESIVVASRDADIGTVCIDGCEVRLMGSEIRLPAGDGTWVAYPDRGEYTGVRPASCAATPGTFVDPVDLTPAGDTPDGVPQSQGDCPVGSAFGQVNGVNVCAPPGTKVNYVPDTATGTNGGTTADSTTTKTDVVNADGTVTTTTTTGSAGSSTTTNVTNNYGSGFASGGGDKGPTTIDLGPAPPAESGDVEFALPGPGPGADGNGGAEKQFAVTGHFTGSQSCIADRTVVAMGVEVVIPLSQLCPWFDMMYKIISMVGLFVALRILVMS